MENQQRQYGYKKRSKTASRIFWGLFFLAAGAAIFINQLGIFSFMDLDLGDVIWTVLLLVILIKSVAHRFWFGTFLSLFFLVWIYSDVLGIPTTLSWWPILGAAIFLSIGFHILFKPKKNDWYFFSAYDVESDSNQDSSRIYSSKKVEAEPVDDFNSNQTNNDANSQGFSEHSDSDSDSETYARASFGSTIKYVNSSNFKKAGINCSFGAVKMYFDNAKIQGGEAEINIEASFCGIELYIPHGWQIIDEMDHIMGGVEEKNPQRHAGDGPKVRMSGNMKFSGIEIIYV